MPSVPTDSKQERLFQSSQNHDLTASFMLVSASQMQMKPSFLLTGYEICCHPNSRAVSTNSENQVFSWVGSGGPWVRPQQPCCEV